MAAVEYDLAQVSAGYSGNMLDPVKVYVSKSLGSYGALTPYVLTDKEQRASVSEVDADYKFDKRELRKQYLAFGALHSVMPLEIKRRTDAEWFRFPIEPIISISGKKTIIRRRPLKSTKGGTIKECWSDDDYSITIRGVITHPDDDSYPETIIKDLNRILDSVGEIRVLHQMLNAMGIDAIAIESVNFPHTKGLSNQNFEIKAFSDTPFELLQALKNPNQI